MNAYESDKVLDFLFTMRTIEAQIRLLLHSLLWFFAIRILS